jgi:nucleoside-diphosphate-sugar epimerase
VEHIHTDPHFGETLAPALEGRTYDLVVATYGRVRIIADVVKGKTNRLVTVSGSAVYAPARDSRWGPLGAPLARPEDGPLQEDPAARGLGHPIWLTEQAVLGAHNEGHYNATILRYPLVYGPNAPANSDWSIVRRILDGRRQFILGDGGLVVTRRGYGANVAHAVLLAVDQPDIASGQIYNVADDHQHSVRQRVELIAAALGHEWEYIDMPQSLARRASRLWTQQEHLAFDTTKIRTQLGYRDVVPAAEATALSARWLADNPPPPGGEVEEQLGDPFDYDAEDALIRAFQQGMDAAAAVPVAEVEAGHMYRHPTQPGEAWSRPSSRRSA